MLKLVICVTKVLVVCDLCISEVVCVVKVLLQLSVGCGVF